MNKLFKFRKCAPKGQSPYSPGHRPGKVGCVANALKGQKQQCSRWAFALSGRNHLHSCTQGDALGCGLFGLPGRSYADGSLLAKP